MNMRRIVFLLCTLSALCCAFSSAAEERGILWDFRKSDVLKGRYPLVLRGKSTVDKNGLFIPVGDNKDRAGAATAGKQNLSVFHRFLLRISAETVFRHPALIRQFSEPAKHPPRWAE